VGRIFPIYAFDVAFNPPFLIYVACLSLSFWSLVTQFAHLDAGGLHPRFAPDLPERTIVIYLLVVAPLFFLVWIGQVVPAIVGHTIPTALLRHAVPYRPQPSETEPLNDGVVERTELTLKEV